MSYILDALERSEQERNQAELPSFRQDNAMMFIKNRKRSSWPLWGGIILFNLIALAVIYYITRPTVVPLAAEHLQDGAPVIHKTDVVSPDVQNLSSRDKNIKTEEVRAPITEKAPTSQNKTTIAEPKVPVQTASDIKATNNESIDVKTTKKNGVQTPVDKTIATANDTLIEPKLSASTPSSQGEITQPQISDTFGSEESANAYASYEDISAPGGGSVVIATEPVEEVVYDERDQYSGISYLHELGASERPRVPKLVFNSHIYSSDASARRVMINNIYLSEGQRFSEMELLYIGEEFIVLDKQGRRFKLPVMRDWLN